MKKSNRNKVIIFAIIVIIGYFAIGNYISNKPVKLYEYELTDEEKLRTNDFVVFRYRNVSFVPNMHLEFSEESVTIDYFVYVPDSRHTNENQEIGWTYDSGEHVQVGTTEISYKDIEPISFFEGEPQLTYLDAGAKNYLGLELFDLSDLAYASGRGSWGNLRDRDWLKWEEYYIVIYDNYFVLLERYKPVTKVEGLEEMRYLKALICDYDG